MWIQLILILIVPSHLLSDVSPPVFTADGASITMSISVPDNLVWRVLLACIS